MRSPVDPWSPSQARESARALHCTLGAGDPRRAILRRELAVDRAFDTPTAFRDLMQRLLPDELDGDARSTMLPEAYDRVHVGWLGPH